jgi:PBSX family phage terminase large subunit
MKQILISDIVAQPHLQRFNSNKLHQLEHGGRAGYKSSKNAIKIALAMLNDKHCEVVIIREDYSDHKDSTFADMKIAFKRLGVGLRQGIHYPNGNDLWIRLPQGNYIHFLHMKNIDKLKGTRPRNPDNEIKIAWYFEITQFKSEWYINESNATFMRGDKDYFWALYEWNDAPKLSHWTYDFMHKMEKRDDAFVNKTNYNDAPTWQQQAFLGKIILKEIEMLKVIDPEQYKSTYLGYPANLGGTVYKQFGDKNIKAATLKYVDITIGVDVGGNDATVFVAKGFKPKYIGMESFAQYYHKNGVTGGIKNINDYVDDFFDFASMIYAIHKLTIIVYIDSANLMFKQLVEERCFYPEYTYIQVEPLPKMKRLKIANKNKSILQGRVDMNEIMFGSEYHTVDPIECPQLVKAYREREYDKNGNPADDGSSDVDSIDSSDYGWLKEMDFIYDMIMR